MVLRGRPLFALSRTYIVSDVSHAGFKSVDFGWGEAVYGGAGQGGEGADPRGADPRRDQLLLQVQERQGGGEHRGAYQPAQGRHGQVPARGRRPHRRDLAARDRASAHSKKDPKEYNIYFDGEWINSYIS
ncbi:hypothetical protein TRIUR3_30690 [Triticum urartu]|uniref:Uncharacterized protein n=1 Tax=Triticum urartu TaxID=4572 RepID=M7ZEZ9_TRIUA|nr:hypothetical protein TRIUR3_30690 [Triticum urartu]